MRILVTNDDGIESPGLRRLVKELGKKHEVYVVAPKNHMSGMSKAMRIKAKYGLVDLEGAKSAWWVDSTPASAVYIGINILLPEKPDIVVSGINRGPNMGVEDFLTSGTIGAAIEAALNNIPGVAVSLACDKARTEEYYEVGSKITSALLMVLSEVNLKKTSIINLNIPMNPKGVIPTSLAWNNYRLPLIIRDDRIEIEANNYRNRYWNLVPGSDVWAVLNGYISITYIDIEMFTSLSNVDISRQIVGELEKILPDILSD